MRSIGIGKGKFFGYNAIEIIDTELVVAVRWISVLWVELRIVDIKEDPRCVNSFIEAKCRDWAEAKKESDVSGAITKLSDDIIGYLRRHKSEDSVRRNIT